MDKKGFKLPCPMCGNDDGNVWVDLCDTESFKCHECDSEFSRGDVVSFIGRWAKALAWLKTAPDVDELA